MSSSGPSGRRKAITLAIVGLTLAGVVVLTLASRDDESTGFEDGYPPSNLTAEEASAPLPGAPPELNAIRAQANELLGGGPDAFHERLAKLQGTPVVVNVWASWCAPCRAEMPALDALQKEKGSDAFQVVAVNVDAGDDVKPKKFLKDTGVETLGYYRDSTMALFNDLKTRGLALGLPVTMLIDGEGCLIAHMNGPAEWSGPDAKRLIETALGS